MVLRAVGAFTVDRELTAGYSLEPTGTAYWSTAYLMGQAWAGARSGPPTFGFAFDAVCQQTHATVRLVRVRVRVCAVSSWLCGGVWVWLNNLK